MPNPPKPLLGHLQPVISYATPKVADIIFYELHDDCVSKDRVRDYGTPHPNTQKFPHHKLVFLAPNDPAEPHIKKWYYAAERCNQDDYNYEMDDQQLVRTYVIPRTEYEESWVQPTDGTIDVEFTDYYFTGEEQKRIGDQTLDSYFVTVVHTYVNHEKILQTGEKGTNRGEEGSTTLLGHTKTASALTGSIVLNRESRLTKGDIWNNTENRLEPRTGVNTTRVSYRPGIKETRTTELDTSEPVIGLTDSQFSKSLVTQDADGADALWAADRLTRENDPTTSSEITSFLGGGVATAAYSLVPEGTAVSGGFLTIAGKIEPLGDGKALSKVTTVADFPTLVDYRYDSQLDGIIKVTKTVVDASTNPTGSSGAGTTTEIKSYDRWRSFHIVSEGVGVEKTTNLPGVFQFRFPPVLTSASWQGAYAYAGSSDRYDYDFDVSLIFDVTEAFSAAVDGRIIRVVTSDPASVVGSYPPTTFSPQSHTVGMVTAAYYTSTAMVWAKTSSRTWQTPLAINSAISITTPALGGGIITVNAYATNSIPATSPTTIPTGWMTIGVTTKKLKLGYYEVIVRQINSPGP